MAKQTSIVKEFFKHLKNNKGQGLVDFAVVVFFCAVIGLAARESGLIDALADTYSDKVQIALGPSGISLSETSASGNQSSTGNTSGDGTTGSGSGTGTGSGAGTGSGTGTGDSTGTGSGTGTGDSTGTGSGTGTGDGTGTGSGTGTGDGTGTGSESGTPGLPAGGGTGGGSGNQGTEGSVSLEEATANRILAVYNNYRGKHVNDSWGDYADTANALRLEGINIDTNTINALVNNKDAWKDTDWVASNLKAATNWQMDADDIIISSFLKRYAEAKRYNVNDYNEFYAAVQNLKSDFAVFSGIDTGVIMSMLKYPDNLSNDGGNVYKGFWNIKKQFWANNTTLTMPADAITDAPRLIAETMNYHGVQLNVTTVSDWEQTPIGERRSDVQQGKLYMLNNEYYVYNSGDTYNIASLDDFKGKSVKLNDPVQKHGQHYNIKSVGDVVIENGNVYVYINSGYIDKHCSSAAGNGNFIKVN